MLWIVFAGMALVIFVAVMAILSLVGRRNGNAVAYALAPAIAGGFAAAIYFFSVTRHFLEGEQLVLFFVWLGLCALCGAALTAWRTRKVRGRAAEKSMSRGISLRAATTCSLLLLQVGLCICAVALFVSSAQMTALLSFLLSFTDYFLWAFPVAMLLLAFLRAPQQTESL